MKGVCKRTRDCPRHAHGRLRELDIVALKTEFLRVKVKIAEERYCCLRFSENAETSSRRQSNVISKTRQPPRKSCRRQRSAPASSLRDCRMK